MELLEGTALPLEVLVGRVLRPRERAEHRPHAVFRRHLRRHVSNVSDVTPSTTRKRSTINTAGGTFGGTVDSAGGPYVHRTVLGSHLRKNSGHRLKIKTMHYQNPDTESLKYSCWSNPFAVLYNTWWMLRKLEAIELACERDGEGAPWLPPAPPPYALVLSPASERYGTSLAADICPAPERWLWTSPPCPAAAESRCCLVVTCSKRKISQGGRSGIKVMRIETRESPPAGRLSSRVILEPLTTLVRGVRLVGCASVTRQPPLIDGTAAAACDAEKSVHFYDINRWHQVEYHYMRRCSSKPPRTKQQRPRDL